MTPEERKRFDILERIVFNYVKTERFVFDKKIQILDGRNFQFGQTTGTKIGTSATDKIGLWGKTPVVQPNAIATIGGGAGDSDGTARNKVDELIVELRKSGIIGT